MAKDGIGEGEDAVRLFINETEITNIYQRYSIQASVFEQPAGFTISLGDGATIADLRKRFKKGDPFRLLVGGNQVCTGTIDSRGATGKPSVMNFRGRDPCSVLMTQYVTADTTFQNESYFELTRKVLDLCGLESTELLTNNESSRQKFSGIASKSTTKSIAIPSELRAKEVALNAELVASAVGLGVGTGGATTQVALRALLGATADTGPVITTQRRVTRKKVTAKVGQTWWEFLQNQYKRSGLFLWAAPDGKFVLGEPDAKQAPSYRIFRERGSTANKVNVLDASLNEGSGGDHVECIAYGRTGSGKNSRLQARGFYRDLSTFAEKLRYSIAFVDKDIASNEEAEYAARRRIAEERRRARRLTYVVAGHRVDAANAFGRAVWAPDTMAEIEDHEYGIFEPLYLHSVEFRRAPESTTTLDFAWPEDLVYAESVNKAA